MQRRRVGRSPLVVSEIGFGAFGISGSRSAASYGPTDDAESARAILRALDLGCTFFDTADVYGHGHSESLLGAALRRTSAGRDAVVATKGGCRLDRPGVQDFSARYLPAAVESSLRRLSRDYVDLYLLHNPPLEVLLAGEIFDTLERLRRAGTIRCGGVSVHSVPEGLAALQHPVCSAVQMAYNLLSQLHPQQAADGLLDVIAATGTGLLAREPLASGFLARRHAVDERYPAGDVRGDYPEAERRLRVTLANSVRRCLPEQPPPSQLALRYVLDEPLVSTAVVGLKTVAQVEEAIGAAALNSFASYYRYDAPVPPGGS